MQMDLGDADLVRHSDKLRQMVDCLLEPSQPQRHQRPVDALDALQSSERTNIANDSREHVLAAYRKKGARLGSVERDTQLVETDGDQLPAFALGQQRAIGVEQH